MGLLRLLTSRGGVLWSWAWFAIFGAPAALTAIRSQREVRYYAAKHMGLKRRMPAAILVVGPVLVTFAASLAIAWAILKLTRSPNATLQSLSTPSQDHRFWLISDRHRTSCPQSLGFWTWYQPTKIRSMSGLAWRYP